MLKSIIYNIYYIFYMYFMIYHKKIRLILSFIIIIYSYILYVTHIFKYILLKI